MPSELTEAPRIAVVIPSYRVKRHILDVLARIPSQVWRVYVVDDACPDGSGAFVREHNQDPRVHVLTHATNKGVGGAMITGYRQAHADGAHVAVKIDGDGQMDPALIDTFARPILRGQADYTKGNRFFNLEDVRQMPIARLVGNAALSFFNKVSSGYWGVFDPTNGYTALSAKLIPLIPWDKVAERYFFESDVLFRLGTLRAVVQDVPMRAHYADEESGLRIRKILVPFLLGHLGNTTKRVFYTYFLRDFSMISVNLALGSLLLLFGVLFGAYKWWTLSHAAVFASSGTVMLAALPILLGFHLTMLALNQDMNNVPRDPLSRSL